MKAIQFEQHGKPDVLKLVELPKPEPVAGQVLVKVAAVGINYADTMHRIGVYPQAAPLPMIPGTDVAGVIEQLGTGFTSFNIGTRVVASLYPGASSGAYAEYVVVSADRIVPIPNGVSFEASLAMLGQGWTAYLLLTQAGKLQRSESVLVHAAVSGVGSLAVQLAKRLGASQVIGLVGSPEKQVLATELGCDHVFLSSDSQWVQNLKDVTEGRGVNIILDSVGAPIVSENLQVLAPFGRFVFYGATSHQWATISSEHALHLLFNNQAFIGFAVPGFVESRTGYAVDLTAKLLSYVDRGELKVIVKDVFPLEQAAEAHQAIEERRTVGKVVLRVE